MNQAEPQSIVRAIRLRLFRLLLAALLVVVVLVLVSMLASTFFFINRFTNPQPPPRSGIASILEAYYLGHGSWEGVEAVLQAEPPGSPQMGRSEWVDSILLDSEGVILLDRASFDSPWIGQPYHPRPEDHLSPLFIPGGRRIGTLVLTHIPSPTAFIGMLTGPLGLTSVFLVLLTLVIGFLLSERIINPLAEVIAAARAVASGKLSARVKARGPDDLRVLSDSFNQMAATLEKNDREQRESITDIAHELRTPLAIMQGKLEGIADGIYPASKEQLAPVLEETYLLEKLIEDLDMLAQAASRQLQFHRDAFDMPELAGHVLASFAGEASGKGIRLELDAAQGLPMAMGDAQRTGQVISNLVGNALRYASGGTCVAVRVGVEEGCLTVQVEDDGPGVPAEDLPFLFDRLWRGEKSRSRALGGAGLGLAIAKQFVELQGGKIWAANRQEGGLQVGFTLPSAK